MISVENMKQHVERTIVGKGVTNNQHATNECHERLPTGIPAVEVTSLDAKAVGQRLRAFWQLPIEFDKRL
jgi:hypothetical protein